jgi:hypothetical protein
MAFSKYDNQQQYVTAVWKTVRDMKIPARLLWYCLCIFVSWMFTFDALL